MAVYFVRHGETKCNIDGVYYGSLDVPITDKGRQQAEHVGELLKDVTFDRIICSGLKRTKETAEAVLSRQNPENPVPKVWEYEPKLNEMNFGAWEGMHYTEVRERYPEDYRAMMDDWVGCAPTDGEYFLDFNRRVIDGFKGLNLSGKENVLVVAHGGSIQCMMCHLLGMDAVNIWHLQIRHGAYTVFDLSYDFPVLQGMNLGVEHE